MNFNNHPITSRYYHNGSESLTYEKADALLQGRCAKRRKLANNTYLERNSFDPTIAVVLHRTDIITLYPDGNVKLNTGGWNTVTTRDRLNRFCPDSVSVHSERGVCFLNHRSTVPVKYSDGSNEYYPWERLCVVSDAVTINLITGKVVEVHGETIEEVLVRWKEDDKERRRLGYWVRLSRSVKRDASNCQQRLAGKSMSRYNGPDCRCHPYGFRAAPEQSVGFICNCGCKFVRQSPPVKLTVKKIMDEENVTIRMAMIRAYGIDRFLLDVNAKVLDASHGYELLTFVVDSWNRITALKMSCPSTKTVYVSPVHPSVQTVPQALDWYFQTKDYLGQVKQQT
jgi:hypothetical protein